MLLGTKQKQLTSELIGLTSDPKWRIMTRDPFVFSDSKTLNYGCALLSLIVMISGSGTGYCLLLLLQRLTLVMLMNASLG